MVEILGRSGMPDNCRTTDQILNVLVDAGWLKPLKYAPSLEQTFFSVGGRSVRKQFKSPQWRSSHTYAQEWSYEPNLESREFMAYLGVPTQEVKDE